eukprot:c43988_g1_i1 orf=135-410(+)
MPSPRQLEEAQSGDRGAAVMRVNEYMVCSSVLETGGYLATNSVRMGRSSSTMESAREVGKLCEEGRLDEALCMVELMEERGIPISSYVVHS